MYFYLFGIHKFQIHEFRGHLFLLLSCCTCAVKYKPWKFVRSNDQALMTKHLEFKLERFTYKLNTMSQTITEIQFS